VKKFFSLNRDFSKNDIVCRSLRNLCKLCGKKNPNAKKKLSELGYFDYAQYKFLGLKDWQDFFVHELHEFTQIITPSFLRKQEYPANNAHRHSEQSEESLAKKQGIAGQARNDGVFF